MRTIIRKFNPISSSKPRWVGTVTPRKQTDDKAGEARVEKENVEPLVAFIKLPPGPPFIGSLVALSMLDTWIKRDKGND